MLLSFILIFLTKAKLPEEFRKLAGQALENAKIKRAKETREKSMSPGYYEGPSYHYTLLKTFSNSNTHDIKGFACNDLHTAVVKRKTFNLTDDFVFVDEYEQKLYHLKKVSHLMEMLKFTNQILHQYFSW